MFYGEYAHTLDDKGRLTLPAKLRGELEEGVVITRGLDGCLFIFTQVDFEKFRASLGERLSFTQKPARQFSRFLFSGAMPTSLDRQGRILISPFLREYAQLNSEAVVIGANNRLEVWSPQRWAQTLAEVEANAEMIAEQFSAITS
jgi:MraZ protein